MSALTVPEATGDQLPALLVTPPWIGAGTRLRAVVEGLVALPGLRLAWRPGEQEKWAALELYLPPGAGQDWPADVARAVTGTWPSGELGVLAMAPEDLVRQLLESFVPRATDTYDCQQRLSRLLARHGDAAAAFVFRTALRDPGETHVVLGPITGVAIAGEMAGWLSRSTDLRRVALTWLERHAAAAARDLIPAALATPGDARASAEVALQALVRRGHRDTVSAAARSYGPAAEAAIDALLDGDPSLVLPAAIPPLPDWLDPAQLPPILLADQAHALPVTAVAHVCTMLLLSWPDELYAGLDRVQPALDSSTLADAVWAVYLRWREAGYPREDFGCLESKSGTLRWLGLVGNDETARRLVR